MKAPERITIDDLQMRSESAAYCSQAILPVDELRAILDLATRVRAFDISELGHLEKACDKNAVNLTGAELRKLLMLAIQAKRNNLPPRLKAILKK